MIQIVAHRQGKALALVTAQKICASCNEVYLKTSANGWNPIRMVPIDEEDYQAKVVLPEGQEIELGYEIHFNGDQTRWYPDISIPETKPSGIGNGINSVFHVPN